MFSLDRILLPIDFSDRCLEARHVVPILAKHFNSQVTVLHVLPPYIGFGVTEMGSVQPSDLMTARRVHARQDLDSFLSEELRNISVQRVLVEGDPARRIVEHAHSEGFGLIVMPTHGYGPFRRLLLGSVTSKVLHDADCPVWTGVHLEKETSVEPMVLGHILCAIDLGPHSAQALSWAHRLATEFKARLTVVHVVASFDFRAGAYSFAPEWQQSMMDDASQAIETLQQSLGSRAEPVLEMGNVAESVSVAAERLKADLLVVGRGAPAGNSGRFRTNAYAIIRRSPCPVVSV